MGGADIMAKDKQGRTALHIAAMWACEGSFKILIEKGADLQAKRHADEYTALHIAVEKCHAPWCKVLLDAGADAEAKNKDGYTALQIAVTKLDAPCYKPLLDAGANTEAKDKNGYTVLMTAAKIGQEKCAKKLNAHDYTYDSKSMYDVPEYNKATERYDACWKLLCDKGADIMAKGNDGYTALHYAVKGRHMAFFDMLLARGADVNAKSEGGYTPLFWAVAKLDTTRNGGRAGFTREKARDERQEVCLTRLLDKGADIEAKTTKEGWTALHKAAFDDRSFCVKILLQRGADPMAKTNDGKTALDLVRQHLHDIIPWDFDPYDMAKQAKYKSYFQNPDKGYNEESGYKKCDSYLEQAQKRKQGGIFGL